MNNQLPPIDSKRKKELCTFLKSISLKFKDLQLLNLAFIHRSASNENVYKANNERLEFLGDSILGTVTATILYTELKDSPEGELAKIKSIVVSEDTLAGIARQIQLDSMMILGHGEEVSGGRVKKSLLADVLEALFGAIYIDGGYKTAFNFISPYIREEIQKVRENRGCKDFKSILQEYCQKKFHCYPKYQLVKSSGLQHEHYFWISVNCGGKTFGPCTGKSKKTAEQEAAKAAYEYFNSCA
ncbi:MAG: ribonuclease III [Termitinemataceae bacterium]|nr:MAG: ribonuclease III [Termitinemataceae bacterium]